MTELKQGDKVWWLNSITLTTSYGTVITVRHDKDIVTLEDDKKRPHHMNAARLTLMTGETK